MEKTKHNIVTYFTSVRLKLTEFGISSSDLQVKMENITRGTETF